MMYYRAWGSPERPPVVLLHAQGCHSGWWEWMAQRLADRFYLIAPDLRGHGDSAWARDYSWDAYARDVEELAEHMGSRPYALVGHSMGAYIGMVVAARGRRRPSALVLADMKTDTTDAELAHLKTASERPGKTFHTMAEAVAAFKLTPPEHAAPQDRLARVADQSVREVAGVWISKFDRRALAIEPVRPVDLVGRLGCRTLFIRGEFSPVMERKPAMALAWNAGSRLEELKGLHHHLLLEGPNEFADLTAQFLV